jgi:CubicO group peptidase (beta-lactamase class C family)
VRQVASEMLCLILLCFIPLVSCRPAYTYQVPEDSGDGWQTASLDDVGLDEELLAKAVARIRNGTYQNVHGIAIVKDDRLVFEEYFSGHKWSYEADEHKGLYIKFDANTLHNLASVTKSVTSALVGIAIDLGFIEGVEARAFDFFPEHADLRDETKDGITLWHLLTMTSGLEWNEGEYGYKDRRNDLIQLWYVPDPVKYILAKPAIAESGKKWYYSGGNTNLLGEIIKKTTGQRMDVFANEHLFAPLGITSYEWDHINADVIHASGNLQLRPRDMAKFGSLYLNDGVWQGKQIVSTEWVQHSTQIQASLPGRQSTEGYGYQWWVGTYYLGSTPVPAFYAAGWGGQQIVVFSDLDMVVVFTGGNYVDPSPVNEIINEYILPAIQ